MAKKRILIIEGEKPISDLLAYTLKKEGFAPKAALDGEQGLRLVKKFNPHMIIMDLMLPDLNGFELCKIITKDSIIPIIIITAKSDTIDKILGLELGADDFITKPFDIREVIARIKAIFRRIELTTEQQELNQAEGIKIGADIEILKNKREVLKNNHRIVLTNKEYELLVFLAENKGRIFSRTELLDKVWGYEFVGDTRTVDIHVQRLRKKLDGHKETSLIETVFGIGYKIP